MSENVPETKPHPQPEPRQRGGGSIYQRKDEHGRTLPTWWICYRFAGKLKRESSHSTNPEDARKLLDRRMKQVWADRRGLEVFNPRAEKIRVRELLDELEKDYESRGCAMRQIRTRLKTLREAFGDMRAVNVTAKVVSDYVDRRLKEDGLAGSTINKETQILGQAFNLGIENGILAKGHAPKIRRQPESEPRQGFFEVGDFEAVVSALPEYLQDFTRFAFLCGWRKGQVASLEWRDVDDAAGLIVARAKNVKNRRPHKLVLEGDLAEIIERRNAAREYKAPSGPGTSKYVFHRDGKRISDPRRAWARACYDAGLPCEVIYKKDFKGKPVLHKRGHEKGEPVIERILSTMIFHDLRRSGVRNMVRSGVRETVAMAISGHRTRSIFDRYNITSDDDLRQAVKQTLEYVKAQPAARNVVAFRKR